MFSLFRIAIEEPAQHLPAIAAYFEASDADLNVTWPDPTRRVLYLVVESTVNPEAIARDTASLTGGELLQLDTDALDLDSLGVTSDPGRGFLSADTRDSIMMAVPPAHYFCPECHVDLARQSHASTCSYAM